MGARTTTSAPSDLLQDVFLAKRFVETLESRLVVATLADREVAPDQSGTQVRWQFFANPSAATTALTEGSDPSTSTTVSTTAITAIIKEYGAYFDISKLFLKSATSGTKEAIVARGAYQAALTIETLCWTLALHDTTTITDAGASVSAENIRTVVSTLETNDAMPHPNTPGGQYYCGVFTPADAYDMMGEGAPTWFQAKSNDFRDSLQTPFRDTPASASLYNCIIKTSTAVQTSSTDNANAVIAGNSFGAIAFDGGMLQARMIETSPEALVSAPLRNRGTIGWHIMFSAELFDSNRVNEVLADT